VAKTKEAYLLFEDSPLHFDVVTNEQTEASANTTEHAVEQGADVSDHIRQEADRVTLQVFVSNTPVRDVNNLYNGQIAGLELQVPKAEKPLVPMPGALMNAGLDALASAINGPEQWKAIVLQFPEKFDNVAFVLSTLIGWKERGVIGDVITPHRTYPNMAITRVTTTRTSDTGAGAELSIELRAVRLVEVASATLPIPSEPRGNVQVNKGKQPTTELPEGPKKSTAKAVADGARGRR
jgi:hypothetical protein